MILARTSHSGRKSFTGSTRANTATGSLAKKPRMLMIGMHLTRTRGGISTLVSDLLRSQLGDEFNVTYLASQAEDLGRSAKLVQAVTTAARVAWHCLFRRPALVYVHVGSNASLYREGALILLARSLRRRVVTHFHAGDVDLYYPKQPAVGRWLIRAALDASHSIIAVSDESAAKIRVVSGCEHIVVVPNGVDISRFSEKLFVDHKPIKLIFVGAIGKLKGENDLLRALAKIRKSGPPVQVSIIGFGAEQLRSKFEEYGIENMIDHLGPVPVGDMPARYAEADIFVLPTHAEAMPMSVLEAMAAGLSVVTTRVGCIPEIIQDGISGHLVEAGDVDALADKIADLAADRQKRALFSRNARRRVAQDFDLKECESAIKEHLLDVLKPDKTSGPKLIARRAIKSAAASIWKKPTPTGVNIIAYHRVVGDLRKAEENGYYGLSVSTDSFRKHCEILRANYDVVSLETAVAELAHGRAVGSMAVITFDDGYLDFYEQAFPVLREMGLPATMFLPTNFIGGKVPLAHDRIFWLLRSASERGVPLDRPLRAAGIDPAIADGFAGPDPSLALTERLVYMPFCMREAVISSMESALGWFDEYPAEYELLNWDMVREMAASGITFGAHTANHVVLPLEDRDTATREVNESKTRLERELGMPIRTFAYPNGEYSDTIRSAVFSSGFTAAVTTRPMINRPGTDTLALGRTSLCEESTRGISGCYSAAVAAFRLGA